MNTLARLKGSVALAALALASISGPVAADAPKAAPVIASAPMWTGFYAGFNAGYGFGTSTGAHNSSHVLTNPWFPIYDGWPEIYLNTFQGAGLAQSGFAGFGQNGFIGGGQIGYNLQLNEKYVVGLEADLQGGGIRGQGRSTGVGTSNFLGLGAIGTNGVALGQTDVQAGLDWLGMLRARVGYLVTPTMLVYATGGLSYGRARVNAAGNSAIDYTEFGQDLQDPAARYGVQGAQQFYGGGNASKILVGWNIGGGLEWMLSQGWSLKTEAMYYNLGSINAATATAAGQMWNNEWIYDNKNPVLHPAGATTGRTKVSFQGIILRAGLNYHFDWASFGQQATAIPGVYNRNGDLAARAPSWNGFYAGLNAGYGFGVNNNAQSAAVTDSDIWSRMSALHGPGYVVASQTNLGVAAAHSGQTSAAQNGFLSGAQVGYNLQLADRYVVGLEADIQGAGIRGAKSRSGLGVDTQVGSDTTIPMAYTESVVGTTFGVSRVEAGVDWFGTLRGRLGYLIKPTLLVYGTAGLSYAGAFAKVESNSTTSFDSTLLMNFAAPAFMNFGAQSHVGGGRNSQVLVGWNLGGGLESKISENWSIKGEAFYYNLGKMNVSTASVAGAIRDTANPLYFGAGGSMFPASTVVGRTSVKFQGIVARAGVNYHFNSDEAPAVFAQR